MPFAVMNVVSTTPDEAIVLAAEVERGSLQEVAGQPGFRSARLYRAEDDTQVVTITEWESREDFLAYRQSDEGRRAVAGAMAAHPKTSFFEIVGVVHGA
jgi:heme-degrading monooxygenase HmoA